MRTWLHKLAHLTGWNRGTTVAATDRRGMVWIGYQCHCGKLSGVHAAWSQRPIDGEFR